MTHNYGSQNLLGKHARLFTSLVYKPWMSLKVVRRRKRHHKNDKPHVADSGDKLGQTADEGTASPATSGPTPASHRGKSA